VGEDEGTWVGKDEGTDEGRAEGDTDGRGDGTCDGKSVAVVGCGLGFATSAVGEGVVGEEVGKCGTEGFIEG
jgi:hypothetical protein